MKKILSLIMILGLCFTLSGCGSETKNNGSKSNPDNTNVNDNNVNDSDDNIDSESDNPLLDDDIYGTYSYTSDSGETNTVTVSKDNNKTHVNGSIDNYKFEFSFDSSDRFNVGETKKFNVYYMDGTEYSPTQIYFYELDSDGNEKAYTNLSITNGEIVAAGYGHPTTTSTSLFR